MPTIDDHCEHIHDYVPHVTDCTVSEFKITGGCWPFLVQLTLPDKIDFGWPYLLYITILVFSK